MVEAERAKATVEIAKLREAVSMRLAKCEDRLLQLTDALLDRLVDKGCSKTVRAPCFQTNANSRTNSRALNEEPSAS